MIFRPMEPTGVIDVGRVVVVGDTVLDLQAGADAGTRGIVGVPTGNHGVEQLGRVRHARIIPTVAELPAPIETGSL